MINCCSRRKLHVYLAHPKNKVLKPDMIYVYAEGSQTSFVYLPHIEEKHLSSRHPALPISEMEMPHTTKGFDVQVCYAHPLTLEWREHEHLNGHH